MGRLGRGLRKLARSPGVPQARHLAERSVAPYLRDDLHRLALDHGLTVDRLSDLERKVENLVGVFSSMSSVVASIETHQPAILNAISSTNGATRLLARETGAVRDLITTLEADVIKRFGDNNSEIVGLASRVDAETGRVDGEIARVDRLTSRLDDEFNRIGELAVRADEGQMQMQLGDEAVREDMRPHIRTLGWLLQRVETVRAEMMHELRYGQSHESSAIEQKIINPEHLDDADIRLNLGAGHIAMEGFVNVDMRELPGIDVVAPIDALPFEPGTIAEIFSSHTVEHFPELQLRRQLLPYWASLLKEGGTFRAVVPDLEAMTRAYVKGKMSFEQLRSVTYGGQEYEGDFHFTGFTPDSLSDLLVECGLEKPTVIAKGRPNGDCLEFEISAVKPSS